MQTQYTFDDDTISDLHKDARGFRPRETYFAWWSTCTDAEKQTEWDSLIDIMQRRGTEQDEDYRVALIKLNQRLADLIAYGAPDLQTAACWIMDSVNANGDTEYADYLLGVPYGTMKKALASTV